MKFLRATLTSIVAILILNTVLYAQTLGTNTRVPEGTCASGTASTDLICGNSADHQVATNPNNAGLENLPRTYYLATNYTNATANYSNITGLVFPVNLNGSYHAICHLFWQSSSSVATPMYIWTGPNASTLTLVTNLLSPFAQTSFQTATATTYSTTFAQTNNVPSATTFMDTIEFALINGTNTGNVQLQAAARGVGTLTIFAGSNCLVQ